MAGVAPFFDDRSRWLLWWPVGMGFGIAVYFSLSYEPAFRHEFMALFIAFAVSCAVFFFWREQLLPFLASMTILSLALGFVSAKMRTDYLATPFLQAKIEDAKIVGRLVNIEEQPNRRRLTLGDLNVEGLDVGAKALILHKIRLAMPLSIPLTATIGDRVSLSASLLPLSEPVSLDGCNFRRQAYFQGIGAAGRVKSSVLTIERRQDKRFWMSAVRYRLIQTLRRRLPDQTGEIAAALIAGDRSGIRPEVRQAFTDAGLAHILAISGLHLTLAAGLVFLIFRRGLALIPPLAENFPIKKWAALGAVLATGAYLSLSGFGIPGQRAFVMIALVMLGILLDRNPLSMRLAAIAASVILLFRPESLLSASFQLSFAAVVGLIAAYEGGWGSLRQWSLEGGYYRRLAAYGLGLMGTTLIATAATAPYALAIFNRFTLQTLIGNFLAIPLTSFFVMPAAMLSVLSLAFGGSDLSFHLLSWGLKQLIHIAKTVSSWPGAAMTAPTPPPAFLGLITLGGLWICFWQNYWRWGGLILCALGGLSYFLRHPPALYVAGDGSVMAYQSGNALYASDVKRGRFFTDQWMKELGCKEKKEWPKNQIKIGPAVLIRRPYGRSYAPLQASKEMCRAQALIATDYVGRACKRWRRIPPLLIDRSVLKRNGSYQVWIAPHKIEAKSIRQSLGKRPWN